MPSKKKSSKKSKKATTKSIIAVLFIVAILAAGLLIAPMIPSLEGSVYHVDINISKKNVEINEGEQLNLNYEASFDYLGVFGKDLNEDVSIEYFDQDGNKVNDLTKPGTYKAVYTITYRKTTKTEEVTITVKEKKTNTNDNPGGGETPGGNENPGENENPGGGETPGDSSGADKLEIHFIDSTATYPYAGDAIYIKAGDTDILIDAGPRQGSAGIIEEYIDQYCTDKVLEFVIATHADQDHIAGFVGTKTAPSIFEYYTCEILIDFALSDKTSALYNNYKTKRDEAVARGMTHYTALQCWNETEGAKKVYSLGEGLELHILYNYYYENKSSDENNYSVCILIKETINNKNFYFTGDLEEKGEQYLVQYNNLPEADLFKAGHHGSPTSSNDVLLDVIKPKIVVFTGVAGKDEYTKDIDRIFPSTFAINRLAKYTDQMYCLGAIRNGNYEALNGTTIVTCENGVISVRGLNNNTLLKDTWWFNSDVEFYKKNTSTYGWCDYLVEEGIPSDGNRKWRTWPEE